MPQWAQKISSVLLQSEFTENPEGLCRIIVEMASPYTDRIASYVEANSGAVHREMLIVPSIVVELPYSAIQYMILSPHVKKIWHDTKVRTLLDIAVPAVGGGKSQGLGFTGKDVTVAVIDTGIFPHPDLIYPESRIVAWKDWVNEREIPYDDNGHGTHVSGIIAGNGVSSRGRYTGMAPEAKLIGLKVLDNEGSGNASDVITALEWCVQNQETYNIRAINLSLGSAAQESAREDPLCRAVSTAWSRGMVVCIAAGNDGPDPQTINTPGITPNAITVGSLNDQETVEADDDLISESSSRGPTIDNTVKPDLLAPGANITSLRAGGGYRTLSGTSMATPMVTGAVAQMFQKWPSLKPDQIKNSLKRNARDMGLQSNFAGAGGLNLDGLFEEPKKEESNQQNPLTTILSGISSSLKSLFGPKPVAKEPTERGLKTGNRDSLSFAMLMLLPLMFV